MVRRRVVAVLFCCLLIPGRWAIGAAEPPEVFPDTERLSAEGDIASAMVDGIDRFLLAELHNAVALRQRHWQRDWTSPAAYLRSVEPNRKRLAHILGLRDGPVKCPQMHLVAKLEQPALVARSPQFDVLAVRWPALADVWGEGLLLVPQVRPPAAEVVAIPDADLLPEDIAGLTDRLPGEEQFARRLAENGCRVLVPVLINRNIEQRYRVKLTNREYLYRPAFELGRHLIGYELQKVLSGLRCLAGKQDDRASSHAVRTGLIGWGEGGMLALYAGALDPAVDVVCSSGYFSSCERRWEEPLERNVFGLLDQFGDAEIATLIAPRVLIVEACSGPSVEIPPGLGGAPARLTTPHLNTVKSELDRARRLVEPLGSAGWLQLVASGDGSGPFGSAETLQRFVEALQPGKEATLAPLGPAPERLLLPDPAERHARQMYEMERHNQWLLAESDYVRQQFCPLVDTAVRDPIPLDEYRKQSESLRQVFCEEVIGRFDRRLDPPRPRTRKAYDTAAWTGYEVVLDVFAPDVFAYGILLVPKGIAPGERRPVVVCQHGLEGRPQSVVAGGHQSYHDFAAQLAERGLVVFAPQNPYIFGDRFRTLQRKANLLGKTLFSIIIPQHQQIVDWLQSLSFVDPDRVAFYGLSYGGKTAMRVPAAVTDYCLSICSGDFNQWVWKNAATNTRGRYSYVFTGEYEIFEFDLGSTFNYAEMAALIAPRPFMVERGHFDGVAPDEQVAYEFAKVRYLYAARLGLADRCRIEWFVGPHTINGQGTFDFLHEQLRWPKPPASAQPQSP